MDAVKKWVEWQYKKMALVGIVREDKLIYCPACLSPWQMSVVARAAGCCPNCGYGVI